MFVWVVDEGLCLFVTCICVGVKCDGQIDVNTCWNEYSNIWKAIKL